MRRVSLLAGCLVALGCLAVSASMRAAGAGPAAKPVTSQQAAAPGETPALPRLFLFATGGTISNRSGGRLTVEELIKSVPNLEKRFRVDGEQFANASSASLSLAQWLDLSRRINERFSKDADLSGVVVTSGTDTLEELAYFLHLTVRDERPVVVVGSMRNPSQTGYEGTANLEDAFRVAADSGSRGLGALVVLNDEINSARDVTKSDATRLDTFSSRDYGLLGRIDGERPVYSRKPVKRHTAASEFDVAKIAELPRVDVFITYQGAPGDLINAAVDAGAKGLVIATAGAGAMSGTQGQGVSYAMGKDVFVVTTTRTGGGATGGGRGTTRRIGGGDLLPVKARILLMLALATTNEPAEVQRIFREY
jgi:L-asparaginase